MSREQNMQLASEKQLYSCNEIKNTLAETLKPKKKSI